MMKLTAFAAAALLALSVPAAAAAQAKPLRIVLVDVEGGAATLFVTPEGKSLLVDTGWPDGMGGPRPAEGQPPIPGPSSADRIAAAVKRMGLTKLDYVMISHYHLDHVGGVKDLLARVPVDIFLDHGLNREAMPPERANETPGPNHAITLYKAYEQLTQNKRRVLRPGDRLNIGSMRLDVVVGDGQMVEKPGPGGRATAHCEGLPDMARDGGEENARSLGFVATFGQARVLDMTDATWNVEKRLVCPTSPVAPVDLLVVSHHGSELSNTPSLIASTNATVAVMQNGPRKGGDKSVLETFARDAPQIALWQQHAATRSPEANRPADYIANLDVPVDAAHELDIEVHRTGEVRVKNMRNGFTQTYPPRRR